MRIGRSEVKLNLEKFLGLKELVDCKAIKKKDACEFLGITPYMYSRLCTKMNEYKKQE